jgi:DNA repair exonuclease SbcCD ATPase subunit
MVAVVPSVENFTCVRPSRCVFLPAMRLQQLEIKGFKSFANETVVNFSEDVIGIVGPNGSGKSNIVDAIRWVLGEQKSRELRLDSMSSVIFNGTKKRKPSGYASVSLTFENTKNLLPTEYNTVTITRVLYRTGESEYRLNGVTCRLKDITSLLLDTGVGSNSYAIIALGMVDDILADKDDSRRKMFEQAAGISKYKVRKRQALNKLKNTSEDLDRIEDLLFEINNNLASLEKQAKRAKRYFELKDQYQVLSLQLARLKINELKDRHHKIQQELTTEEDNYRGYEPRSINWKPRWRSNARPTSTRKKHCRTASENSITSLARSADWRTTARCRSSACSLSSKTARSCSVIFTVPRAASPLCRNSWKTTVRISTPRSEWKLASNWSSRPPKMGSVESAKATEPSKPISM